AQALRSPGEEERGRSASQILLFVAGAPCLLKFAGQIQRLRQGRPLDGPSLHLLRGKIASVVPLCLNTGSLRSVPALSSDHCRGGGVARGSGVPCVLKFASSSTLRAECLLSGGVLHGTRDSRGAGWCVAGEHGHARIPRGTDATPAEHNPDSQK